MKLQITSRTRSSLANTTFAQARGGPGYAASPAEDAALALAEESVDLARELDEAFVAAWAAVRLAGALLETGQPASAVGLLLSSAGGERLVLVPGGWRVMPRAADALLARPRPPQPSRARGRLRRGHAVAVRLPLATA